MMNSYSVFARYYDILTENISYSERAEYFSDILKEYRITGGIVLDAACGTGSLSVELDRLGFDVIGADASAEMLAQAVSKSRGGKIQFINQSIQNLDLYGTVKAVICALDSINHITDEKELISAFKRISLFLENDGVFIFDVNSAYKHEVILSDNTFVYDCDDVYCVWQNSRDGDTVAINLDFFERDESGAYFRSGESFCERYYPKVVLENALNHAGMKIEAVYADDTFNDPDQYSERIIYVAKKK